MKTFPWKCCTSKSNRKHNAFTEGILKLNLLHSTQPDTPSGSIDVKVILYDDWG